jgi:hypothetical protein
VDLETQKFEIRNPKFETNPNDEIQNPKPLALMVLNI